MPTSSSTNTLYRESAIQDMMGKPPGWLLHSGLMTIAGVFIIVLGLTSLIRYPEKVEAPFLLQTEKIPLALHAGTMSVIDTVFAKNGASVTAGDTLLVFRSETNWRPVQALDLWLLGVENDLPIEPSENLGASNLLKVRVLPTSEASGYPAAIQQPFTTLRTILSAQESYQLTNGISQEITAIKREIADAERLSLSLNRQVNLYDQELDFQQKQTDRMQALEEDGIVSTQEAEQAAAQTIAARRQREVLVSSDIQNQLRVQQLRQQILQRQLTHHEQLADFDRQLRTQLKLLRSALTEYRDRYFLIAREAGVLTWQPSVREQATVSPSDPLGFLRGDGDTQTMVARLQLPSLGMGKVTVGDRVILDFAAYPSREYGQVEGTLLTLDPIALPDQQGNYLRLATVALPDTLQTSYGKTLPFQYNLTGTARIITAERTLLARLLDQFLNLTKNT